MGRLYQDGRKKSASDWTPQVRRYYVQALGNLLTKIVALIEHQQGSSFVGEIIRWLTGYTQRQFEGHLKKQTDFETFFAQAPKPNLSRKLIKGLICGIRVEEIEEPTMREIRYLDKLIDELAKGKAMDKILRA